MTTIVNFFAGPGVGKSTSAASLFSHLKSLDVNAELVQEHAKEWAWEKRPIYCQAQIFGEQLGRQERLRAAGVDVVVTDSPLIQSLVYTPPSYPLTWRAAVVDLFNQFDNLNFFIKRTKKFNPAGRYHNFEESVGIDAETYRLLNELEIPFFEITVNDIEMIGKIVMAHKENKNVHSVV